ncbi:hypothetical protein CCP4SC76_3360004 [Gammaproteobacteria bacterium]
MLSPLSRQNDQVRSLSSLIMTTFPLLRQGRFRIALFEACSAFTHVTALRPAHSQSG